MHYFIKYKVIWIFLVSIKHEHFFFQRSMLKILKKFSKVALPQHETMKAFKKIQLDFFCSSLIIATVEEQYKRGDMKFMWFGRDGLHPP